MRLLKGNKLLHKKEVFEKLLYKFFQ